MMPTVLVLVRVGVGAGAVCPGGRFVQEGGLSPATSSRTVPVRVLYVSQSLRLSRPQHYS